MTDAEQQMAAVMANLEATNDMADQLDRLKTSLEGRGWSTPAAETASLTITNTLLQLAAIGRH
ncbi:hypothetical protein [Microbacterium sp. NPDC078849]|uniref:hypothetical protein n=1 Tax=unclassified Microbacterium TaxID=2609290 RepID=UPI00344F58DD